MALDDLIKTKDPGTDDWVPASYQGCKFEGKVYGLPFEANPGNYNVIMFNKDMTDAKGLKPTDDWTFEQFGEMAQKLTDKSKKIWGTDAAYFMNYYDLDTISRFADLLQATARTEMDLHRGYAAQFGIGRHWIV